MVLSKVRKLLANILSLDTEDVPSRLPFTKENGITPMDVAALVIACEKHFRIVIHDEEVSAFTCAADLAAHIRHMLEEGSNLPQNFSEEDRTAWFYE